MRRSDLQVTSYVHVDNKAYGPKIGIFSCQVASHLLTDGVTKMYQRELILHDLCWEFCSLAVHASFCPVFGGY